MSFRNKLQYFLVKNLQISNKEAQMLLIKKEIKVNAKVISANIEILPEDTIEKGGLILQLGKEFKYLAYYKPRGIETTLNTEIQSNLKAILPINGVFPVGRLDKESEGLLLLTDDGRQYDKILRKENRTEKEYEVKVNNPVTEEFVKSMSNGIKIMGKMTLPCSVTKINEHTFKIILIQGLNRQIRRMCYKLGYEIESLKRIRIGKVELLDMIPGEIRTIEKKWFSPE